VLISTTISVVVGGVLDLIEGDLSTPITLLCEEWLTKALPQADCLKKPLFTVLLKNSLLPNAKVRTALIYLRWTLVLF